MNNIQNRINEARQRNPTVDSCFRKVRERRDSTMLRGSDYVRALELAVVELEEQYADLKKRHLEASEKGMEPINPRTKD